MIAAEGDLLSLTGITCRGSPQVGPLLKSRDDERPGVRRKTYAAVVAWVVARVIGNPSGLTFGMLRGWIMPTSGITRVEVGGLLVVTRIRQARERETRVVGTDQHTLMGTHSTGWILAD